MESGASARRAWPIAVSSNRPSARWLNTDRPASMRIKRNTESGSCADLGGDLLRGLGAVRELVGDAELGRGVERLGYPGALGRFEQCDVSRHHRAGGFLQHCAG